jgi:hypothetical protein
MNHDQLFIIAVNHGKKFREKPFSRNFSRKIFSRKDFFVVLASKICANFFVKKFSYKEKFFSRNYLNEKFFAKIFHGNFFFFFSRNFFRVSFTKNIFAKISAQKLFRQFFRQNFTKYFFAKILRENFCAN